MVVYLHVRHAGDGVAHQDDGVVAQAAPRQLRRGRGEGGIYMHGRVSVARGVSQRAQSRTLMVLILGVWLIIEVRVRRPSSVRQLLPSRSKGLSDRSRYVILDCGPSA